MRLRFILSVSVFALVSFSHAAVVTLDDAIHFALAKNYSIRISQLNTSINRANYWASWGKFDPAIQLDYTYREDASPQPTDPYGQVRPPASLIATDTYDGTLQGLLPFGTQYSFGVNGQNYRGTFNSYTGQYYTFAGVTLTQPLLRNFGFGANLADIRIAKVNRSESEWQYKQSIIDTITNVMFAYYELQYAKHTLEVAKSSHESAANLVTENERRYQVGDRSQSDIVAAQARAAEREEAILFAQRAVIDSTNALRQLIYDQHNPALVSIPLDIIDAAEITPAKVDAAADFPRALTDRPDYQQAKLEVQRGRVNRSQKANQLLPEVNFVGSYGYNGFGLSWSASRQDVRDQDRRSYSAGAVFRMPLTLTTERGQYRAAKIQLQKSEVQLQQLEQAIMIDLATAAGQLETTHQRVLATSHARALAQQNLDSEIKKLHAGSSNTIWVLQFQEELAAVQLGEFRARADEQRAVAEYDRQIGNTLNHWHVSVIGDKAPKF